MLKKVICSKSKILKKSENKIYFGWVKGCVAVPWDTDSVFFVFGSTKKKEIFSHTKNATERFIAHF